MKICSSSNALIQSWTNSNLVFICTRAGAWPALLTLTLLFKIARTAQNYWTALGIALCYSSVSKDSSMHWSHTLVRRIVAQCIAVEHSVQSQSQNSLARVDRTWIAVQPVLSTPLRIRGVSEQTGWEEQLHPWQVSLSWNHHHHHHHHRNHQINQMCQGYGREKQKRI